MLSCKTWYLVGLGVLAATFFTSSSSQSGMVGQLLSAHATSLAQRASGKASLYLAKVQPAASKCSRQAVYAFNAGPGVDVATINIEVARHQAEMARIQAELARAQAERASALATADYCRRFGVTSSAVRITAPDGTI